jgi:hypothetical protein
LSWLHLPRNPQVDLYPWHKSVLVSNPSKFEWVSELVRKVFTSSRCYLHWCLLKAESTLMAWFLESLPPSICSMEIKHVSLRASSDDNGLTFES